MQTRDTWPNEVIERGFALAKILLWHTSTGGQYRVACSALPSGKGLDAEKSLPRASLNALMPFARLKDCGRYLAGGGRGV